MSETPLSKDAQIAKLARELVRGSIIEDAASRFVEMVLREAHASRIEPLNDRIAALEAKLAKAVEALGILADDTNWFDAVEDDGTFSPAWRGTGSPEEIARTTLAELKGEK